MAIRLDRRKQPRRPARRGRLPCRTVGDGTEAVHPEDRCVLFLVAATDWQRSGHVGMGCRELACVPDRCPHYGWRSGACILRGAREPSTVRRRTREYGVSARIHSRDLPQLTAREERAPAPVTATECFTAGRRGRDGPADGEVDRPGGRGPDATFDRQGTRRRGRGPGSARRPSAPVKPRLARVSSWRLATKALRPAPAEPRSAGMRDCLTAEIDV